MNCTVMVAQAELAVSAEEKGHDHECKNVVEYRKGFVKCWKEYEKCFIIYGNDGNMLSTPTGFPVLQGVPFQLILVTHDESTFYKNNHCKIQWVNNNAKAVAEKKGKGQSMMVSKFLTSEWGWLIDGEE